MKKQLTILLILPYFLIAQVKKNAVVPKTESKSQRSKVQTKSNPTNQNARFGTTKANSNQLAGNQFEYDVVGNVTKDLTQGITNITYYGFSTMELDPMVNQVLPHHYYVPHEITFEDNRKIVNNYDGSGKKLSTKLLINGVVSVEYAYLGEMTMIKIGTGDWKVQEIAFEGGRAIPDPNDPNKYTYEFDIEDHTGSPRVTFRANSNNQLEIVRSQDYDPFGQILEGINYQNPSDTLRRKYFFNGKEYLITFGLKMYDYGKRQYNPRLGRYYQIDPKASWMPSWSPYVFSFDNPLRYRDYDGQIPYPISVRSFAPFSSFGFGFHGDNRGYSTSSSATARVHQQINFDTDKSGFSARAWSSPSYYANSPSGAVTGNPTIEFTKGLSISQNGDSKTFGFATHSAGANPKTPDGSPNIDVFSDFSITANSKTGTLAISGKLTGDNFPSTEAFISDPSGQNVFLGVGQIAEGVGRNTGPFTELPGQNRNNPITSFNISVTTDKKGNFTGVTSGNQNYSIADWNKKFTNTPTQR